MAFGEYESIQTDANMSAIANLIEGSPKKAGEPWRVVLVGGLAKEIEVLMPYIRQHIKNPEKYIIEANTSAPIYGALRLAGAHIDERN